jgi:hypothetical protein
LLSACGDTSGNGASTSPSTSFAPLTVPEDAAPAGEIQQSTTSQGPSGSTARAQALLDSVTVSAGTNCEEGIGTIAVSHPPFGGSEVLLLTAIVDGRQFSERPAEGGRGLVVSAVPCDSASRTVVVVASTEQGTTTRAFAVRMP